MLSDSTYEELEALEAIGVLQYEVALRPEPSLVYLSPGITSLIGLSVETIQANPRCLLERIAPDQREQFDADLDSVARAMVGPLEIRFQLPDGRELYLRQFGQLTLDDSGAPQRIRGIARDVTPLTQTLRALRDSENRYDILLDTAPFGVILARNSQVIDINPTARAIFGVPADVEPSSLALEEYLAPYELQRIRDYGRRRAAGLEAPTEYEVAIVRPGGELRHLLVGAQPIEYQGKPTVLTSFVDITDRKRAEEELAASRTRFQAIVESAPDGLYVEHEGSVLYANRASLALLGVSRLDELLGQSLDQFVHELDNAVMKEKTSDNAGQVRWSRLKALRTDGEERYLERALLDGDFMGQPARFGILREVTTQVRFQRELEQRLAFESVISQISTQFINARPDAMDQAINHALELLGALSDVDRSFLTLVSPDLQVVSSGFAWAREGIDAHEDIIQGVSLQEYPYAWHALMEDGLLYVPALDELPPSAAAERVLFEQQGVQSSIVLPLYSEGVWRGFFGFETVHQEKRWTTEEINSLRLAAQVFSYAVSRMTSEEERRSLEMQVQTAQKMESLGVLVGGIAHDFNNLLTGILGNASIAMQDSTPGSAVHESVAEVERAAKHAAQLVRQMLAYAGHGKASKRRLDLNHLVEDIGHLIRTSISKKAKLSFDLAEAAPMVEADETQLRQIVMNLITNAAQALENEPGNIWLRTGVRELEPAFLRRVYLGSEAPKGRYAFVEVEDTGCGMTPETVARMFDPFFTSKPHGTGLGLAATLGIVRAHNGVIAVDTQPGQGSRLTVFLPLAEGPSDNRKPSAPRPASVPVPSSLSGSVLIVDDEPVVRAVAKRILERVGFSVIEACDGREGVEQFLKYAPELHLVLLDMAMPEMDGEQAFLEMRAKGPVVPVVFSSGYLPRVAVDRLLEEPATAFVPKPYRPSHLVEVITALIAEKTHPESAP